MRWWIYECLVTNSTAETHRQLCLHCPPNVLLKKDYEWIQCHTSEDGFPSQSIISYVLMYDTQVQLAQLLGREEADMDDKVFKQMTVAIRNGLL